jgi:hypothetical protein
VSGFFLVLVTIPVFAFFSMVTTGGMAGVVFLKLLGSIGPLEFMAFARNAEQADGHEKQ